MVWQISKIREICVCICVHIYLIVYINITDSNYYISSDITNLYNHIVIYDLYLSVYVHPTPPVSSSNPRHLKSPAGFLSSFPPLKVLSAIYFAKKCLFRQTHIIYHIYNILRYPMRFHDIPLNITIEFIIYCGVSSFCPWRFPCPHDPPGATLAPWLEPPEQRPWDMPWYDQEIYTKHNQKYDIWKHESWMYIYMHVRMYVFNCVHIYQCVYICIYMYIHIYIYVYIPTYMCI